MAIERWLIQVPGYTRHDRLFIRQAYSQDSQEAT